MGTEPLRILHLEDDPADAERVQGELARTGLSGTFLRVNSKDEFVRAVADFKPDIVLSDHSLGSFGAGAVLEHLRAVHPTTPVIVVTGASSEDLIVGYIKAGIADFVSKSNLMRLRPAVETALAARRKLGRLTPRQIEVLGFIAKGHSTAEIARQLQLSIKTIETHRMALMDRLGIHQLAGLIRFAIVVGLVPLDL
ncbi:MAG TPA: response regulator transcription factor [Gemmatimonadales bacterium]|nr:response regulator transcription factor [Gemmatimonadales bacterium]